MWPKEKRENMCQIPHFVTLTSSDEDWTTAFNTSKWFFRKPCVIWVWVMHRRVGILTFSCGVLSLNLLQDFVLHEACHMIILLNSDCNSLCNIVHHPITLLSHRQSTGRGLSLLSMWFLMQTCVLYESAASSNRNPRSWQRGESHHQGSDLETTTVLAP